VRGENGRGPIGFLAAAVSSAVSIGLLVITATVLWVDARTKSGPHDLDWSFYVLVGGTLLGILLAAYVAWQLLSPIGSAYRRGGLSIVCSFATVLLMLICIPVNQLFGRIGLFVLLGLCGVLATMLARRARRLGSGG
jgi:hypothetical protein